MLQEEKLMFYFIFYFLFGIFTIRPVTVNILSSSNKIDGHDMAEIIMKVALNTITRKQLVVYFYTCLLFYLFCHLYVLNSQDPDDPKNKEIWNKNKIK